MEHNMVVITAAGRLPLFFFTLTSISVSTWLEWLAVFVRSHLGLELHILDGLNKK